MNRQDYQNLIDKTQLKIDELQEEYKKNPNRLIEDYDEVLKQSIIGVIANFRANGVLRDDIIGNIDILIRNREFVSDQYCNKSGSDN
ncbi:MAG: hypothetical protein HFI09_05060 [Bacilli bacterium]|nr:hypothetical protein [Bacilli bacterium]